MMDMISHPVTLVIVIPFWTSEPLMIDINFCFLEKCDTIEPPKQQMKVLSVPHPVPAGRRSQSSFSSTEGT